MYVNKQTDIIPALEKSHFFRDEAAMLGETGVAPFVGYDVDTSDTYHCVRYGARHFISDDRRINEDDPFDADREATMLVTDKLQLRRERQFVTDFWSTGVWGTDKVGGTDFTKWSDAGSSSPIEDIRTYKRIIRRSISKDPNTLVLGDLVYDALMEHPDIIGRIAVTQMGVANEDLLATLFGVEKILVGRSIYTSDNEGTPESSVTYSASWDDDALLLYLPQRPSIWTPAAGYTFVWQTNIDGNTGPQWIRKYRDEERGGDVIEARSYFDQKALVTDAGLFLSDAAD